MRIAGVYLLAVTAAVPQNRLQERTDLAGLLQVTSGLKDVLTSAVLVAGPLISSAFSMFLPGPPS